MTRPRKTKAHGGNRELSENTTAWASYSGAEHSADAADALIRLGVTLAMQGCEALALLTDDSAPGVVEAADCITAARQFLALPSEFSYAIKGTRAGEP